MYIKFPDTQVLAKEGNLLFQFLKKGFEKPLEALTKLFNLPTWDVRSCQTIR